MHKCNATLLRYSLRMVANKLPSLHIPCSYAGMQVYLYISSSKHVLGCLVAEQITSASPVVPNLDDCATSSAIRCGPRHTDPCIPMSAPPFAKHKRLSSLPSTHTTSSTMPASQLAFTGCCTGPKLNTLDHPASHCYTQQRVSVGSSQTTLFPSPGLLSSQPRKQPKQNVLTRWLATSQHKAAAAQSLLPGLQPDSPLSAGLAAASRPQHEGLQAAVDSKPAQSDLGGPIPMASLADITNRPPASIASENSSMTEESLRTKDSPLGSVSVGAAATAALTEQRHQQQQPAQAELHSVNQQPGQQQQCRPVQAGEHSAHCQQPPACTGLLLGKRVKARSELVLADPQPEQHRVLPAGRQHQVLKRLQSAVVRVDREKTARAACGIRVMWVSSQARRRGIASLLLDTARFKLTFSSFCYYMD